jgi:tetratricopeptide (TPR) repeat protein
MITQNIKKIYLLVFCIFVSGTQLFAQEQRDALAEYRRNNWDAAIEICRSEIETNSENIDAHVVLCWSLLKLNRYEEARTIALRALRLNRYDVRVLEILGESLFHLGYNNESLRYFQEYINLAPEGQRIDVAYFYEGEIFIRLSKFRHADIALSTALHYMPNNARWWVRLGWAQENAGDLRDALVAYEKALSLDSALIDAGRGAERIRNTLGGQRR